MLFEQTLFGTIDKVQITIDRLRQFEPPEGYYVTFSGGKDSVVVLDLVKQAGVKYDAHYNLTTVDPPELVRFIREKHPEVQIHRPTKTMWKLIEKHGCPPARTMRYCCEELKEHGGGGRVCVTGVRWEESYQRSKRRMVEVCMKDDTRTFLHPIIDWTEAEVWEYIKLYNVQYCKLYDEGFRRIGCLLCPNCGVKEKLAQMERYPKYVKLYLRAFERMLKVRKAKGLKTQWETPEDVMNWWIYGKKSTVQNEQIVIFD